MSRYLFAKKLNVADEEIKRLENSVIKLNKNIEDLNDFTENKLPNVITKIEQQYKDLTSKIERVKTASIGEITQVFTTNINKKREDKKEEVKLKFLYRDSNTQEQDRQRQIQQKLEGASSTGNLVFKNKEDADKFLANINSTMERLTTEVIQLCKTEQDNMQQSINHEIETVINSVKTTMQSLEKEFQDRDINININYQSVVNINSLKIDNINKKQLIGEERKTITVDKTGIIAGIARFLNKNWGKEKIEVKQYRIHIKDIQNRTIATFENNIFKPLNQLIKQEKKQISTTLQQNANTIKDEFTKLVNELQYSIEQEKNPSLEEKRQYKEVIKELNQKYQRTHEDWTDHAHTFQVKSIVTQEDSYQ